MNVKRILWCSHISSMVSLRQWSGAELRAWHLQRFPQTRRISLLLWISSETFPHPVRLPPFSALPSPPSTPLPTRGLYILEFCKRKNTPRDTIRNGSVIDTFLFFFLFFYLEKRIVENSNTRGENENWNLIKYALLLLVFFSPKKISRPKKCVENTNI